MTTHRWLAVSLVVLIPAWAIAEDRQRSDARPADDAFSQFVRTTPALPPDQERRALHVPPGFEVQLVASEPEIAKPLNMAFDARGRLWITDTLEYPYAAPPDRPGRDTIKILDDTDGDGRADTITTFAEGLNIPIGICPYGDGAIVFSIPHIWHLRDTNGDGRADMREKLYGPFGYDRDTHGLNNAFRRGLDGWLYACHGFNNQTDVSGTDGHQISMNSGNTYRLRLDGSRIEHFTWGQVNPFGMTLDALGNIFTADCHSKPIYQLLRGGYYPSFGKPHDGLGFVPPMMDHLHGSTAIAGLAYYTGENFPPEFRHNMFSGNVMTSRVNRDTLSQHGATIAAHEQPDLVVSRDPWFRPVDLQMGPDGALYVADFYNRIIGHYEVPLEHPGRDRTSGRVWRIVYRGDDVESRPAVMPPPLGDAAFPELLQALDHPVLTYRMLAADQIVDRGEHDAAARLAAALSDGGLTARQQVHAIWVLHRLAKLPDALLEAAARHSDRQVRVASIKVLAEREPWSAVARQLAMAGLQDEDAFVRLAAADAVARQGDRHCVRPLLEALLACPPNDPLLRQAMRIALRNRLRDGQVFDEIAPDSLSHRELREVADVTLALSSREAGSVLVEALGQGAVFPHRIPDYLAHAVRIAPPHRLTDLVAVARRQFPDDRDQQIRLLASMRASIEENAQAADVIDAWATELATRLLGAQPGSPSSLEDGPAPLAWQFKAHARGDSSRSPNPWVTELRQSSDGSRDLFHCTLPSGEQLTGLWVSEAFPIPRVLSFFVAGHDGYPDKPAAGNNLVRLRDARTHEILATNRPPRNDIAQRIEWQLLPWVGRQGYIELVDGDDGGAYAWLAVGRFSLPRLNPTRRAEQMKQGCELVVRHRLEALKPYLCQLVASDNVAWTVQLEAAKALLALEREVRLAALIAACENRDEPREWRALKAAVVDRDEKVIARLLNETMKTAPAATQRAMAEVLSSDRSGMEQLIALVEESIAPPQLLTQAVIAEKLAARADVRLRERAKELTSGLPPKDAETPSLIARVHHDYLENGGGAERGATVFEKHCAACHQLQGKGLVIGPQLDGVGGRGLARLLEDLLDTNRNVDVAFRTTILELKDGRLLSGLRRRQEGGLLVLADAKGEEFRVAMDEIEEMHDSRLSLMPTNFGQVLNIQQLRDLLAYLLADEGGSRADQPTNE